MNIKEYLDKYGIKQTWFASQLGVSSVMLNQIISGKKKLPKRHWTKVVVLSQGEIKLEDLLELEQLYEKYESQVFQKKYVRDGRDRCKLPLPPPQN